MRIALIGFASGSQPVDWKKRGAFENAFVIALTGDRRATLIDDSLIQAALTGLGYSGGLNLSCSEAQRIGGAIGCDFFVLGKTDAFTRSEEAGKSHEESFAGVLIADGRTGQLAFFDFILKKAATRAAAQLAARLELEARVARYVDTCLAFHRARLLATAAASEAAEDLPEAGSSLAAGFQPPEFLQRAKPVYTEAADRADINATVEAQVIFRANGEIGAVEIVRWAGFGLEDSALHAIRQLKFKPATRNGQPVTVRALVRYNFRRLSEADTNKKP